MEGCTLRYKEKDLETYLTAKEYIDTVLIPLVSFDLTDDEAIMNKAREAEVMQLFTTELEKELAGRTLLAPSFNYQLKAKKELEVERLKEWEQAFMAQPFSAIFHITFDTSWKKHEKNLEGHLLWIPAVNSGDMDMEDIQKLIREHVKETVSLIRSFWN